MIDPSDFEGMRHRRRVRKLRRALRRGEFTQREAMEMLKELHEQLCEAERHLRAAQDALSAAGDAGFAYLAGAPTATWSQRLGKTAWSVRRADRRVLPLMGAVRNATGARSGANAL
jgi:hypothetical protein